jgi:8-oxo-dGTP pyrophosphatase MutT (NUDIX family)
MHRRNLLEQLQAYSQRYPEEHATVERFVDFVASEPRCFERDCWRGHVTGSAWLLDPAGTALLLTHHRKLDIWVQLGGHSDGDPDTRTVALREAEEESGLAVQLLEPDILDIDIHEIPARKSDPAHFHFDVRYAFAAPSRVFAVSGESHDLAWVGLDDLESFTTEQSILRMRRKWLIQQ